MRPVVGRGTLIERSYVGPFTSIYHDCVIAETEIEYSIVLGGSSVRDLDGRIEASLIGRNVAISRSPALPKAYRFVVGDNAEIAIL